MKKGKVKWYNAAKGYGFLETDGGNDVFVHRTGLANAHENLLPDQEVEFDIEEGKKGLMAVNLKLAN